MRIEFGEYLPDLPALDNPGCTVARNVIPAGNSYEPFPSGGVYSNALDARAQGAIATKDSDGDTRNFAGNATKLYRMVSASYTDVSKVGGYNTNAQELWQFTRFNALLLATNFADPIQTFDIDSGSNFADLSGSPPKARYITTIGSFVVVGNTFDGVDGNVPNRIRWCGLNDVTAWTVSASTQADYTDLDVSKGWVRGIVGGEYGVVFQERAISRMEYVGSPIVWLIREVEKDKGTTIPGSIIKVGGLIYYICFDFSFNAFDGSQSIPIGANKVDKTLASEIDTSNLDRVSCSMHPTKPLIIWAVPVTGNTNGRANKFYIYNYSPNATKRWATVEDIDIEILYRSLSEGYTLDQLNAFGTLDSLPFSLDSRIWTGDNNILSAFNSDHKQINFNSTPMNAVLESREMEIYPGRRAEVYLLRPLIDGSATVTLQMGTRDLQSDSVSYDAVASLTSNGDVDTRSESRYHRIRINTSGNFNNIIGVDLLEVSSGGKR